MSYLRTFVLLKEEESQGGGGGRIAAIGAVMPSGNVVLEWANGTRGIAMFHSVDALLAAQNGHDRTVLRWGIWDDDEQRLTVTAPRFGRHLQSARSPGPGAELASTMRPEDVRAILDRTGAVRRGHFLLTSGLHTDLFLLCAQVMQYPHELAPLASAMAAPFQAEKIEVVVGPAVGGIILAYEVARQLHTRGIFAEKNSDGRMILRRGFTMRPGERALVVEDAITTGGSTRGVIDAVRAAGAEVVGVAVLVDRSGGTVDFSAPLHALLTMRIEAWPPSECPLCRASVPLVVPKDPA